MAEFGRSYAIVSRHEGGYLNDGDDHGGETYRGIARNIHPSWQGWGIVDAHKRGNGPIKRGAFIRDSLLDDMVEEFYNDRFERFLLDRVNSQAVADIYFDFIILASRAVATMQEALNELGHRVAVDNRMGPGTLAAINRADPGKLHDLYKKKRKLYHETRVAQGRVHPKWLPGWLARTANFPDLITSKRTGLMVFGGVLLGFTIWRISKNKNNGKNQKLGLDEIEIQVA